MYFLLGLVDVLDLSAIVIPAQAKDPRGEKGFDLRMPGGPGELSSHPGELPPEVLTEPYVTLSRHTAPVIQPEFRHLVANEQTDQDVVGQLGPAPADYEGIDPAVACASHEARCTAAYSHK